MESVQYPTGRFAPKGAPLTEAERARLVERIRVLPAHAREAVAGLPEGQFDVPVREGGWTPRQIIHHLADSHLNAFTRFKLALTEDFPTVKPYDQDAWARTADVSGVPVEASLAILEGLHLRWTSLLEAMTPSDFGRRVEHPEVGVIDLDFLLQMYGWHGEHHVAQVRGFAASRGW